MVQFASLASGTNPLPQIAADDFDGLANFAVRNKQSLPGELHLEKMQQILQIRNGMECI